MFELGEKVRIARCVVGVNQRIEHFDIDNLIKDDKWNNSFMRDMMNYIGKEVVIGHINLARNEVSFEDGIPYGWSFMSIDKIEEEKKEMPKDILEFMTYDHLYAKARLSEIPGRSSMNKSMLIAALKNPPVPEKKVESLGVRLNSQIKEEGTCSYAYRNGKGECFWPSDICHARLKSNKIDEAVLNIKWHYDNHKNKELYKRFVEWMLNDSPFKNCFLTKKWKDAYEDGVYLNCDESINRIASSAIALRGGSEFPATLPVMFSLVDGGYDPTISWFISYQFVRKGVKWHFNGDGGGGHKVFAISSANTANLSKFLKQGFHLEQGKPANQWANFYGIFHCIQGNDDYSDGNMFATMNNIFNVKKAGAFVAAGRLTDKEFYEGLSKFQEFVLK